MATSWTERDRSGFAAGDLRRIVPVWKPIPYNGIQRCHLPDNGSMGFALTDDNVVPVKQNNATRFLPTSGSYPMLFLPPTADLTVGEVQELLKATTTTFDDSMLMSSLRASKNIKKNSEFLQKLEMLARQLRVGDDSLLAKLEIPKAVMHVVKKIPDGLTESRMMKDDLLGNGGGVCHADVPSMDGNKVLLYSSGKKLSDLVCLPISVDANAQQILRPNWIRMKSKTFSRKIYQVSSMKIRDKAVCGVRMDHRVYIGEIDVNMSFEQIIRIQERDNYITDLSLSQYVPEFLYVTDGGCVKIIDMETGATVDEYQKLSKRRQWWACQFASHPRCFVFTRRNMVMLRDRRATSQVSLNLLRSASQAVLQGERFCSYASSTIPDVLPHLHYVGSSHSLFLIDDRYPRIPLLTWKHQLMGTPGFISAVLWSSSDVADLNSGSSSSLEDAIFLASRISQECVAFHVRHSRDSACAQLSVSVSPPLQLASPKELTAALMREGHMEDLRSSLFLELPLHGMCCASLTAHRRLTVLYQTVDGNLYSQAFSHADHAERCQSSSAVSTKKFKSSMQQADDTCRWIDKLTSSVPLISLDSNGGNGRHSDANAANMFMQVTKASPHSHFCQSCCKCDRVRSDVDISDEVCLKCRMSVQFTNTLTRNVNESRLIVGGSLPVDNDPLCVPDYTPGEQLKTKQRSTLTSCNAMLQRILDTWQDEPDYDSQTDVDMSFISPAMNSQTSESLGRRLDSTSETGVADNPEGINRSRVSETMFSSLPQLAKQSYPTLNELDNVTLNGENVNYIGYPEKKITTGSGDVVMDLTSEIASDDAIQPSFSQEMTIHSAAQMADAACDNVNHIKKATRSQSHYPRRKQRSNVDGF